MKIEKQNPGFAKRVKSWLTGKYVENGSTASQNIPAGKWVTWKGQVYKAKTAITAGDTLSSSNLGTNEEGLMNAILVRHQIDAKIDGNAYITDTNGTRIIFNDKINPILRKYPYNATGVKLIYYATYTEDIIIAVQNSEGSWIMGASGYKLDYYTYEEVQ